MPIWTFWAVLFQNRINMWRNAGRVDRKLEIGPGGARLEGFETLNVVAGRSVDYVLDCSKSLPFESGTFLAIYASHVVEHLPWYKANDILREWVRVLKPGGMLEVWVPDGLKICESVVAAEEGKLTDTPDGWLRLNPEGDPYLWACGRMFYGANPGYPSWHTAMYTPKSLQQLFHRAGLSHVRKLCAKENSGLDRHGWINLGVRGVKP
jgi:SAM-dependent methyltransferase